jgi:hypothetical protein
MPDFFKGSVFILVKHRVGILDKILSGIIKLWIIIHNSLTGFFFQLISTTKFSEFSVRKLNS